MSTIKCVNGRFDDNQPHDFDVPTLDTLGAAALMFCRACGEVRSLQPSPPDDGDARANAHPIRTKRTT